MDKYIDIHAHWCLFGRNPDDVAAELLWLEGQGFEKIALFPLPGLGASPEKVWQMLPRAYREMISLTVEKASNDDLEAWLSFKKFWEGKGSSLELLSFLDIRAWDGVQSLDDWWEAGHAGFKSILIEEEDDAKMKMAPLRNATGISRGAYFEAQRRVFSMASRLEVPLIYHADLSLHRGFIEECLQDNPDLRVNIPHLGFSRKQMAEMLKLYPQLKSDISSLGPYIEKEGASYKSFMRDFPEQVMLGSDVISSYDMRPAKGYVDCVKALELPEEVEAKVLYSNAIDFIYGE